jgi:hypothetical protein
MEGLAGASRTTAATRGCGAPHIPKKLPGLSSGQGDASFQEIDVLVVCGDDVLIFSDKAIAWQEDKDFDTCVVALVPPRG